MLTVLSNGSYAENISNMLSYTQLFKQHEMNFITKSVLKMLNLNPQFAIHFLCHVRVFILVFHS